MQINTSKHIIILANLLLIILMVLPFSLTAQEDAAQTEKKKYYITRSGQKTRIVMGSSTGLSGEDASFLFDSRATEDFQQRRSRYSKLRDAVNETEQVANIVEVEKKETNPSTGSLGFRIAQQNIRYLQKEKEAERIARDNINRGASVEELTYLIEKFGNKPSYFVNGIKVDPQIAAGISDKDVLSREMKVSNTTTGNPNGEIWFLLTSKAFDRLDLGVSYADNSMDTSDDPRQIYDEQSSMGDDFWDDLATTKESVDRSSLTPEQRKTLSEQEEEIEELRRQIEGFGKNPVVASPRKSESIYGPEGQYYPPTNTETRVANNKVGNRFVQTEEEVVGFRDSPQERSRRARDRGEVYNPIRTEEDVIQVTNQARDPEITRDTPKRSIRRIKERQRNQ